MAPWLPKVHHGCRAGERERERAVIAGHVTCVGMMASSRLHAASPNEMPGVFGQSPTDPSSASGVRGGGRGGGDSGEED